MGRNSLPSRFNNTIMLTRIFQKTIPWRSILGKIESHASSYHRFKSDIQVEARARPHQPKPNDETVLRRSHSVRSHAT